MRDVRCYTACYGDYDTPQKIQEPVAWFFGDVDAPAGWIKKSFSAPWWDELPNAAKAKCLKIFPWLALGTDWQTCLWLDSNIQWNDHAALMADEYKGDFVVLAQDWTDNINDEFHLCINSDRPYIQDCKPSFVAQQQAYMHVMDTPGIRCGVMLRRNTPRVFTICHEWLQEFLAWQNWRDQTPLRKVLHDLNEEVELVPQTAKKAWKLQLEIVPHSYQKRTQKRRYGNR